MDTEGLQYLAVTSRLPKKFKARYVGVEYEFIPGEAVNMPLDAARHIFGFGEDDKTRAFHRLGWLTLVEGQEAAMERLSKIEFEPIQQVFEMASAPKRLRGRKRISDDRSPVNAGESEEESSDFSEDSSQAASQDF